MGTNERQRQERKKARTGITLKQNVVTSGLHQRYLRATSRVLNFWRESRCLPETWEDFDGAVSLWLEHIFSEGLPKGYGSDALAALQYFLPEVSGKLCLSWKLLKTWNRIEPPLRVLPISPLVIGAMAGLCVQVGWLRPAALLLLGFDTFLRPGELYHLQVRDITWASGRAAVALHNTKTGQRKGVDEMVFCESMVANRWLRLATSSLQPHEVILDRSPQDFRSLFFNLLDYLQIPGHVTLYSLRRGGATWHFVTHRALEVTLLRGRWQSTSTARIYLQDSAAALAHFQLSPGHRRRLKQWCNCL